MSSADHQACGQANGVSLSWCKTMPAPVAQLPGLRAGSQPALRVLCVDLPMNQRRGLLMERLGGDGRQGLFVNGTRMSAKVSLNRTRIGTDDMGFHGFLGFT